MHKEWQKYKIIFFKKCCKLLCNAKPEERPKYFDDKKYKKPEDHITYDYVENIKIHDIRQDVRVDTGKQKVGDENIFKEPDITFSNLNNTLKTFFECKVLGKNSEYINNGIGRFVTENYKFPNMSFYGMLGYVRDSDSAVERYKSLKDSIDKKKSKIGLTKESITENSNLQVVFKTEHKTNEAKYNPKIEITHILHCW